RSDVATEFLSRRVELTDRTLAFEHALHSTTLPPEVVESVASTASILRTPTVDRLEDGTLWAWEGCHIDSGCCPGSCSHVWNYAVAHAHLFPDLQASMLDSHFEFGFNCGPLGEKGGMNFRLMVPLAQGSLPWHIASDGQMGLIVQAYRDWRMSGDRKALERRWPAMKRALSYAWVAWDTDRDGLVDGDQHNTYDINFQGPNPLSQFFYLAALRAGEEAARVVGDEAFAAECGNLFESGRNRTVERLWNGEYFQQDCDVLGPDAPKYQHGSGCLSDQVFGQQAATLAGLGDLVPPEFVRSSLQAIFRHNFRDPIGDHPNLQRVFALSDESGLLLCSWPKGGRPRFPFVYSDEVWTGVEYQVATHLALVGLETEAITLAAAVRRRYDGRRRNPYNEVECGSHYARALASYGLLVALSGIRIDLAANEIRVSRRALPGRYLFSCPAAWGTISVPQRGSPDRIEVHVVEGQLPGGIRIVETDG
ncbi:MAG: GH116 family glycosyl hydrolase, partial [Fimbriimonadaceae bacterium]